VLRAHSPSTRGAGKVQTPVKPSPSNYRPRDMGGELIRGCKAPPVQTVPRLGRDSIYEAIYCIPVALERRATSNLSRVDRPPGKKRESAISRLTHETPGRISVPCHGKALPSICNRNIPESARQSVACIAIVLITCNHIWKPYAKADMCRQPKAIETPSHMSCDLSRSCLWDA
jgi:hypothetical protein